MKHYKDLNTNEIYAYEANGSQDAWIKPGLVAITDEEADAIRTAITEANVEAAIAANPPVDATTKLAQFLAANPDVLAIIQGS